MHFRWVVALTPRLRFHDAFKKIMFPCQPYLQKNVNREKEREIVNKMTKAELDSMHADYLSMLAKEALEKNNEQM